MPPDVPLAADRAAPPPAEPRLSPAALAAAAGAHAVALAAVLWTASLDRPAPLPAPDFDVITVEIVAPPPREEPSPAEPAPVEPDAAESEPFAFEPQLDLNRFAVPDVLRMREPGAADDAAAAPLSDDVRLALAALSRCRAVAETAAEAAPCAALASAQLVEDFSGENALAFFDPAMIRAARVLERRRQAPTNPLATGTDHRLSSSDGMRDRLPPSNPDPYFGD